MLPQSYQHMLSSISPPGKPLRRTSQMGKPLRRTIGDRLAVIRYNAKHADEAKSQMTPAIDPKQESRSEYVLILGNNENRCLHVFFTI